MARKHVVKYWARLLQKKTFTEAEVPEDIRAEAVAMSVTLPLREDMKVKESNKETE